MIASGSTPLTNRNEEHQQAIRDLKAQHGSRLVILAHHYQRPELVALGDMRGDSYELSKKAAQTEAEWIVFCGVHFMAQSAAILARPEQSVFHANINSGCPMAEMAERGQVERAWEEIRRLQPAKQTVPVTYMNTLADVKAFVGEQGGLVCTSSNAGKAFTWAYERGQTVLFVPDEHLGRNTARQHGISEDEIAVYDPKAGELGGLTEERLASAKLVLWAGYCHVHTWFSVGQIESARQQYPGCQIYVHPECQAEVVERADGAGSTGFLVQAVAQAEPGTTVIIGTETNLVTRLAMEYPDREVLPLDRSICPNMFRITLGNLRQTLEMLPEHNRIEVDPGERQGALLALQRMLEI